MKQALRRWMTVLAVTGLATPPGVRAAGGEAVARSFEEQAAVRLDSYKNQSARIADEKIPLIRQINELEEQNIALRDKIDAALNATSENNKNFEALSNRLTGLNAQTDFAVRFLREFLDGFESRINIAEEQHYKDQLTAVRNALDHPDLAPTARFEPLLGAVDLDLQRAETLLGGYRFDGRAIAADGTVKSGTVAVVGPVAYFSNPQSGGDVSGTLRFHTGTIEPAVDALDAAHAQMVSRFVARQDNVLPLDPSLGSAATLQSAKVRLVDHIASGGPVGYSILALGLVAVVLTLIKFLDLGRFRPVDSGVLVGMIRTARENGAEAAITESAGKIRGPIGEMLELGVRNIRANGVLLEEMMLSVVVRRRPEIERYLPFLAITVAAAPLLGLLGTVTGMIRTFALITVFGTSDPGALSGGISEALVTTELGLMVAVPTLVVHAILTRMVKTRLADMERVAFEFVRTVALEESKAAAA